MYAIVDIETTGGHASGSGITEVAIILHNGSEIEGKFQTLINPGVAIPRYITALTGIHDEMVRTAPRFEAVAERIHNLLSGRIFVAHNVNFDYSFLKHHLAAAGFELNARKLCTVRLARKVFPGNRSYGLGNICRALEIQIEARHRAMGDAQATAILFERILQHDKDNALPKMLKGRTADQYLPPNLSAEHINALPEQAGVYYFYDQKGKVVYVGKATNLRQRVRSHFSNNDSGKRKQEFLRNIFSISFKVCSGELSALILESVEIRRLWPLYNRSQKKYHHEYGLYTFEDQNGYMRLFIERKKKNLNAVYTFNFLHEGQVVLRKLVASHGLSESLCFIDRSGGLVAMEPAQEYNVRVKTAISSLHEQLPSFVVTDGDAHTKNYILMERGRFAGMAELPSHIEHADINTIREKLTAYPDNDYIRGLVYQYAQKFPDRKIEIFS